MLVRLLIPFCGLAMAAMSVVTAHAQSFCSSDGKVAPIALLERFISADCPDCWGDTRLGKSSAGVLALDWVVPSPLGDEAALSTAATREAVERLQLLRADPPTATHSRFRKTISSRQKSSLRVAHGLPFNNYIGASISYKAHTKSRGISRHDTRQNTDAWLVLVETIAAGSDGTAIERNLVRGVLVTPVRYSLNSDASTGQEFSEARPMSIPEGSRPERLRLVGWIQDAKGHVVNIAQSSCRN